MNTESKPLSFTGLGLLIYPGQTEDKLLEQLLGNIAEWFIDNPVPAWRKQLAEKSLKH